MAAQNTREGDNGSNVDDGFGPKSCEICGRPLPEGHRGDGGGKGPVVSHERTISDHSAVNYVLD